MGWGKAGNEGLGPCQIGLGFAAPKAPLGRRACVAERLCQGIPEQRVYLGRRLCDLLNSIGFGMFRPP